MRHAAFYHSRRVKPVIHAFIHPVFPGSSRRGKCFKVFTRFLKGIFHSDHRSIRGKYRPCLFAVQCKTGQPEGGIGIIPIPVYIPAAALRNAVGRPQPARSHNIPPYHLIGGGPGQRVRTRLQKQQRHKAFKYRSAPGQQHASGIRAHASASQPKPMLRRNAPKRYCGIAAQQVFRCKKVVSARRGSAALSIYSYAEQSAFSVEKQLQPPRLRFAPHSFGCFKRPLLLIAFLRGAGPKRRNSKLRQLKLPVFFLRYPLPCLSARRSPQIGTYSLAAFRHCLNKQRGILSRFIIAAFPLCRRLDKPRCREQTGTVIAAIHRRNKIAQPLPGFYIIPVIMTSPIFFQSLGSKKALLNNFKGKRSGQQPRIHSAGKRKQRKAYIAYGSPRAEALVRLLLIIIRRKPVAVIARIIKESQRPYKQHAQRPILPRSRTLLRRKPFLRNIIVNNGRKAVKRA